MLNIVELAKRIEALEAKVAELEAAKASDEGVGDEGVGEDAPKRAKGKKR